MNCQKCKGKAVIEMRQHHLALCKDHFLEWVLIQTQRAIEKYKMFGKEDKVLVAVSGGKDSLALWDVLWRLGYSADGIYINLGIQTPEYAYSDESHRYAVQFAQERGLLLHDINIKETYGENIIEISKRSRRGKGRPCSICGLVKRYLMNRVANQGGYKILVTGHNLDDEVGVLLGNTLQWSVNMMMRQAPVLPEAPGFTSKAKPFCRLCERETAAYSILRGIQYVYEECPYSDGSTLLFHKEQLNKIEHEMPGTKMRFYLGFLESKKAGLFNNIDQPEGLPEIHCTNCGQLTTVEGLCAFCRLVEKKS